MHDTPASPTRWTGQRTDFGFQVTRELYDFWREHGYAENPNRLSDEAFWRLWELIKVVEIELEIAYYH